MSKIKDKVYDFKDRLKDRKMLTLVVTLVAIIVVLGIVIFKKQLEYRGLAENGYNNAFYQLVEYINQTEVLLAKSTITNSSKHSAETLTNIWRDSTLAESYLARLPIGTQELETTQKFLNQLSDYSYSLANKAISGNDLSQEDLDNLTTLHGYASSLKDTLNQLEIDLHSGNIKWGELEKAGGEALTQEASNLSQSSFGSMVEDLHEYAGLIYDGAFSNHMTNPERVGLTGDEIDEAKAMEVAKNFIGQDKVIEITSNGQTQNGNIECYSFNINAQNDEIFWIAISKKGGHVVFMNSNRDIANESMSPEDAVKKGEEFLESKEFKNMKPTYYLNNGGILIVNYAYEQNGITMYPDLVKVKVALDNGEILGIESTGYLNCHRDTREIAEAKITLEEAKEKVNKNLEINSSGLAVIPTEWGTEVLCYEFKGKTADNDFIVYINAETGDEEDILMIINTPEGTLTE